MDKKESPSKEEEDLFVSVRAKRFARYLNFVHDREHRQGQVDAAVEAAKAVAEKGQTWLVMEVGTVWPNAAFCVLFAG